MEPNKNAELIEALTQLKESMNKVTTMLENTNDKETYNIVIDNYINATMDKMDVPTYELNNAISEFCTKSIEDLQEEVK